MSVRVFCLPEQRPKPGDRLILSEEESHYVVRVRRRRSSDRVEVLDGVSSKWNSKLVVADPRQAVVQIEQKISLGPSIPKVHLQIGMPDTSATIEIITQASELGAESIIFSHCTRSQGRHPNNERIHRTLRAAMRQSGRTTPMSIIGPVDFDKAIRYAEQKSAFFASVHHQQLTEPSHPIQDESCVFVGPEGGFTDVEVQTLISANYTPFGLGPWTLRTQTAAIASLCRILCTATIPPPSDKGQRAPC